MRTWSGAAIPMTAQPPVGVNAPVGALGAPRSVQSAAMAAERAGDRVRRYRRLRRLTQQQLAEKAGTDKGYVSRLEAGDIEEPSVDVLSRLAGALEIPVRALADPRLYDDRMPDWEAALLADPRFTEDEKQAILTLGRAALAGKRHEAAS